MQHGGGYQWFSTMLPQLLLVAFALWYALTACTQGLSLTALAALPIPSQLSYTSKQSSALQDLLGDLQAAVAAPAAEAVDDTDEESDSDEGAPIASAGMDGFKTGMKLKTSCQPWEQRLGRLLLPPSAAPGPLTDSIFNSMQFHAQLVYEPVLGRTTDAVQPLKNEYSKLSGQRAQLIREIASIRKDCATKAVEMSVLRLGMFTRRVTHRNYLSGTLPPLCCALLLTNCWCRAQYHHLVAAVGPAGQAPQCPGAAVLCGGRGEII